MAGGKVPKIIKTFGPYELLEKVGLGGMGSVYLARRVGKDELVALKIANRTVASDAVLSQRFHNEFKIASQLHHPNLVRALDYGVENHFPYLAMEFVPGRSLEKLLKDQGRLSLPEALAVFGQVAAALDFIHKNHLIHRDVKPGNILIDPTGQAKLADLGLIKDLDSAALLTHSRTGLGTLEFAAPEQFDDAKHVDLRCDIYALAAALYVALSGKVPFGPGSQMRVLMHKLEHQFTPLSKLVEGVSPALDQLVIRALHPDPAQRPASVADFLTGMRSTEPPAELLQPKPLAPTAATVAERRAGERHPVQIAATLGVLHTAKKDWTGQIIDVSAGGMCLQISRRFEPNTLLNVSVPGEQSDQPSSHLVRTCWIKSLPDKTFLLGCVFMNPLENEELDRFLLRDLTQTHMLGKPKPRV